MNKILIFAASALLAIVAVFLIVTPKPPKHGPEIVVNPPDTVQL